LKNRLKSCGYWSVAPKAIDVHLVKNEIAPTSMGEPPYPRIFGVLANALYKATGKRVYRQPFFGRRSYSADLIAVVANENKASCNNCYSSQACPRLRFAISIK